MIETADNERASMYACRDINHIMSELGISDSGYSDDEISASRKKHGGNDITNKSKTTLLYCVKRAFINPFSIILFVLGVISAFTDTIFINGYKGSFTSVIIIFSMLLASGLVRLTQELRARKITHNLINLVSTQVTVLRNGGWMNVPSAEIVVGDRIKIKAGDRIPADMRVISASDLFVSQSTITGESVILEKTNDTLHKKPQSLDDYCNILFTGSTVTGGSGEGIAISVGAETVYGGLNIKGNGKTNGFDRGANSIAWVMIRFMAILVPVVFVLSGVTKGNWLEAFLFSLSVAVGLTPELLPMVVNACLAKGSYSMSKKQTVVKNINAMQSFGSMDVLCVDKTGTLTGDEITLEYYMDVLGNESQKTLDFAYIASCYHTGVANHIDKAIKKVSEYENSKNHFARLLQNYKKTDEEPFDYSRRFSSVVVAQGDKQLEIIKGSVDEVAGRCKYVEFAGTVATIEGEKLSAVHNVVDEMLEDGMKVIAVAYRDNDILSDSEDNYTLLGYLAFFDAPKTSAKSAISTLRKLNVNIKVLTGDQKLVAESVCRRLGISTENIITGAELKTISENEMPMVIESTNVFAGLSPKQKGYIVQILQNNGHTVGFLGDGMNDLPAILQADVGISVENATEAVKESAEVILMKKDLNVLEEGIIEGRKAFANMTKYIKITASSNFGNICAIVVASILLPFFPMTSVQLLLLNLLYDILCLILPWDNVDDKMLSNPLEWSGRTLGGFMRFFGPLSSIFDLVTFAVLFFVICPYVCGGGFSTLSSSGQILFISLFQTGWFLESMWTQVLIIHLLRTENMSIVKSRAATPVIIATITGITIYSMLPLTSLGVALGLCKMPAAYFLFLIAVVSAYLLLVSVAKIFYIRKNRKLI